MGTPGCIAKDVLESKGESSIAAAAYRAGLDLVETKTRALIASLPGKLSQRNSFSHPPALLPGAVMRACSGARMKRVRQDRTLGWPGRLRLSAAVHDSKSGAA